ncbi:MAG: IS200/IS605 family transposase [Bacteroidetes bacterium]|nr:IS200/IS605 family transposase [Bacteroidota bacterium]
MSFVKIWVHVVWSTKLREPLLTKKIKYQLTIHIREYAATKNIHIDFMNGHVDHIHCLISLNPDQSIAKVVQLIKGESSFWVNRSGLTKEKFEWQEEYFAVSISESKLNVVREYIKNQERHHSKKTFQQEHDEFISKYKF